MRMNDVDEFENGVGDVGMSELPDDTTQSEQKVLALMEQMQQQAGVGRMQPPANVPQNNTPVQEQVLDDSPAKMMNIRSTVEDESNFWEVTDLPTKYRLYPEGTVIKARPLKVLEVKKLTSINEYNADQVINDILRKCIRGIDVNELYISDKLYLIFWLRANSFRDNEYVVDFACPKCQKESNYHFNIDCVNIDPIKDGYSEKTIMKLSNGDEITLRLLKVKDEIGIDSFKDRYESIITSSGDEVEDELLGLSFMIETINGKHLDPLTKYNYLLGLNAQDYSNIDTYVNENIVGVKPYMNVTCNQCGGESQIGISFRPDFFLPKYRS